MKSTVAPVLVVLLAAACGGGGGGGTSDAAKKTYLEQAEKVCATALKAKKELKTPTEVDALPAYVSRIVQIADTTTSSLMALTPPERDRTEIEKRVLKPLTKQLASAHSYEEQLAAAVKAKDNATVVKLLGDPPNKTVVDLNWMKDFGFHSCLEAADTGS